MNNENNNMVGNGLNDVINNNPNPNPIGNENTVMMGANNIPNEQVVLGNQNQIVTPTPGPVVNPAPNVAQTLNDNSVLMGGAEPQNMMANNVPPVSPMGPVTDGAYNATPNNMGIGNVSPEVPMNNQNSMGMGSPLPNMNQNMTQNVGQMPGQQPMPNNNPGVQPNLGLGGGAPMPAFENPGAIGVTPPPVSEKEEKKKKKGMNKTLFVILIIVLIAAVGGGVYWYLNLNKGSSGIKVELKDISYGLNEEVSTDIKTYATITGTNSSNCVLDTSKIDTSKIGQYEYTVTCGSTPYKGKALVQDSEAPIATPLSVTKTINSTIKPEDFIATCYDSGACSYEFEDASAVNTLMGTVGGPTKVKIVVKDENNNSVVVEANLTVINDPIKAIYECESKAQNVENLNAEMTVKHSLGILGTNASDGSYTFGNFGTLTYNFKFTDESQYSELLNKFKSEQKITIGDVTGAANFNQTDMTITMIQDLNIDNLKTQYGADKFLSYRTIQQYYTTTLGYTCRIQASNNTDTNE